MVPNWFLTTTSQSDYSSISKLRKMSDKIRLTLVKNGDHKSQKIVVISRSWEEILSSAKNKLRISKPERVFSAGGKELFKIDLNTLENDAFLVISDKKDFIGTKRSEEIDFSTKVIGDIDVIQKQNTICHIIASKTYVEDEAVKQLENVSKILLNVKYAIGMPDIHPGRGFPIGTSIATSGIIYPHLIGTDIGCGMSLFKTDSQLSKSKVDKWVKNLYLDKDWDGNTSKFLQDRNVECTDFDKNSLGTIGGGNHFGELQEIVSIKDDVEAAKLNLDPDYFYLLVHSGSRGYGQSILEGHENKFGTKGLIDTSKEAEEYMTLHDNACKWARANRDLIAHRFLECIGAEAENILDIWHNNVEKKKFENGESLWLHRKGAAPLDKGPIVIPGSRGAYSYLVIMDDSTKSEHAGYSVAHGAGRKWKRSKALGMGQSQKNIVDTLTTTSLGSRVICEDKDLLFEEMPEAYKDIDSVVQDLVDEKIIKIIAIFKPVITYKTRK
jgi:release factor H-coupled RctB family protein